MNQSNQDNQDNQDSQDDQNGDSYSKLNVDVLLLTDKVRIVKDKIRKTSWYKVIANWKLYKELRHLEKEADEIGERLQKIERNPIQIVKRP